MLHRLLPLIIILFVPLTASSQITGFIDDFEDASIDTLWNGQAHTLWNNISPGTYSLTEQNGVLEIGYTRDSNSGANDHIRFIPPEGIDISDNPRASVRIKSSVNTTFTFYLAFLPQFGFLESFSVSVPGDNEWHVYSFAVDPNSFGNHNLSYINLYFDQGSTSNRTGTIELDDLKISGFILEVVDFEASVVEGTSVQLNWASSDSSATNFYQVYRSTQQGFEISPETFVIGTQNTSFLNQGLEPYTHYSFKVVPVDTSGEVFLPSNEIQVETFDLLNTPEISITSTNGSEIGLYEEFSIEYTLNNVGIANPYDPDDIDVHAWFKSPSGDTTQIFGFYDNYNNADQWRLYFSPFETGTWEYQIIVNDVGGKDSTEIASFTAAASEYNGPLKISDSNPNYLEYHNGSPFYGLAVYYPWNVQESGLNRLADFGLNMIGYWNGTYDGSGNGGGRYLVESMDSGLGRYDQRKLGRIEEILGWLEERDMKLMYAIWAHPFLRDGAPGWDPIDWPGNNPYQDIVEAVDFYTDSLAWEYQKKQYRYLIARLSHHRALGIWEIINEMHGTTGFANDEGSAIAWVDKVHDYLKENDPYKRPTTASFGDANLWNQRDIKTEIVNRHYYEAQGYPRPFNDNVRDGLFNVVETYQTMKRTDDRPAMFGEAGYTSMFSEVSSFDYTQEFHNAYWAGLATGMASTPFWWDYTTLSIFPDIRMRVYLSLKNFISTLDLYSTIHTPETKNQDGAHIYSMKADTSSFGWLWSYEKSDASETTFNIKTHATGTYALTWYKTWDGEIAMIDTVLAVDNELRITSPVIPGSRRDVAYKLHQIENGENATRLQIIILADELVAGTDSSYAIYAVVTDDEGRLIEDASNEITFSLTGNGSLSETLVSADNGVAKVFYSPSTTDGNVFSITVDANGLTSASLNDIMVTDTEDEAIFSVPDRFELKQNYPNPFNPSTTISYTVPENGLVQLEVYDINGRKVATLINQVQSVGQYQVSFDASSLASGVYLYTLKSGSFIQTNRMVLLK